MQNKQLNVDPLTDMPVEYTMVPPVPSNELGMARPVFNNAQQLAAESVFGDVRQRQASLGNNTPLFKKACGSYKK
jgi:hypothetical protein